MGLITTLGKFTPRNVVTLTPHTFGINPASLIADENLQKGDHHESAGNY